VKTDVLMTAEDVDAATKKNAQLSPARTIGPLVVNLRPTAAIG